MTEMLDSLRYSLGEILPELLAAGAILVIGWLVAIIVRAVVRRALKGVHLNERVQSGGAGGMDLESGIAKGFYFVLLLMTLVAFFEALGLELVSGPLQALTTQVFAFVPKLAGGGILLLIAWILATVVRKMVTMALSATTLDEKLSTEAGMRPLSATLGNVLYGLIFLLFLPAILSTLELEGLLVPVQNMVGEILAMLPNIFGAVVIGAVGWFVAKILRDLVGNVLAAAGSDKLGDRIGLRGTMTLSKLVALVVYIFVLLPAVIAALQALQIEAISAPATEMLGSVMAVLPNLFAAAIILAIAFFVGRLVAELIGNLLGGMGFDQLPGILGLGNAVSGGATPSQLVGKLTLFTVMLFATVEAANRLGFTRVSDLVDMFIQFGGQILLGVVIIGAGIWLADLAHGAMTRLRGGGSDWVAGLVRYGILGLVFAIGLRSMGLADDIVNLAFGLTLGAVAAAVALSFGLGGREAAGRQMEHWLSRMRGESSPGS